MPACSRAPTEALPTEEEVTASEYGDGGAFLLGLQRDNPAAYNEFIASNAKQWWEPTRQPIHKKLSILLSLMMHTVARTFQRWKADGTMEKAEMAAAKQRQLNEKLGLEGPRATQDDVGKQSQLAAGESPENALSNTSGEALSAADLESLVASLDMQTSMMNQAATVVQRFARGQVARNGCTAMRIAIMNLTILKG